MTPGNMAVVSHIPARTLGPDVLRGASIQAGQNGSGSALDLPSRPGPRAGVGMDAVGLAQHPPRKPARLAARAVHLRSPAAGPATFRSTTSTSTRTCATDASARIAQVSLSGCVSADRPGSGRRRKSAPPESFSAVADRRHTTHPGPAGRPAPCVVAGGLGEMVDSASRTPDESTI